MDSDRLTPNQVVAWNLRRARKSHGWTQEEAAERLEPHIGERWSLAVFSAAERSVDGKRIRHFTADELHAFARTFELPIPYFFCPPPWADDAGGIGHPGSTETTSAMDYLDAVFDLGEDAVEWLLKGVVPLEAGTTRMLRRWGRHFAEMVDYRKREVARLIAEEEEGEE